MSESEHRLATATGVCTGPHGDIPPTRVYVDMYPTGPVVKCRLFPELNCTPNETCIWTKPAEKPKVDNIVRCTTSEGEYALNTTTFEMSLPAIEGVVILTHAEAGIVEALMRHQGEAVGRPALHTAYATGSYVPPDLKTVDVHIYRIRGKIKVASGNPNVISTITGSGYRFAPNPRSAHRRRIQR